MVMEKFIRRFNTSPSSKKKIDTITCNFPVNGCFGVNLDDLCQRDNQEIPIVVTQLCAYLLSIGGLTTEGVFRINGNSRIIDSLRITANDQYSLSVSEDGDDDNNSDMFMIELDRIGDVHSAASLLKSFLRELPLGVVPEDITMELVETFTQNPDDALLHLKTCLHQLPPLNCCLLRYICNFLHKVVQNQSKTRMSFTSLGIIFGPSIFRFARNTETLALQASVNSLMALLVENIKNLFVMNSVTGEEVTGHVSRQQKVTNNKMISCVEDIHARRTTDVNRYGQQQPKLNYPEVTVEVKQHQPPRIVGVDLSNSYYRGARTTREVIVTPTPSSISESEPISIRTASSSSLKGSLLAAAGDMELSGILQTCLRDCIIQHAFPGMRRPPKSTPKPHGFFHSNHGSPFTEEPFLFTSPVNGYLNQSGDRNASGGNCYVQPQQIGIQIYSDVGGHRKQPINGGGIDESRGSYLLNPNGNAVSSLSSNIFNLHKESGDQNFHAWNSTNRKTKECNGDDIDVGIAVSSLSTQGTTSRGMSGGLSNCSNRLVADTTRNCILNISPKPPKSPNLETTFNLLVQRLTQKRELARRPEKIGEMTLEQLDAEKLALQKTLLSFESIHGRPKEHHERIVMRPLYDRYRRVKRLLTTISTAKLSNDNPQACIRDLLRYPLGSDESDDDGEHKVPKIRKPTVELVRSSQVVQSSPSSTTMSLHSESGSANSRPEGQVSISKMWEPWAAVGGVIGHQSPTVNVNDGLTHLSPNNVINQSHQIATASSITRNYSSPKSSQNEWFGSLGLSSTRMQPAQSSQPIMSIYMNAAAQVNENINKAGNGEDWCRDDGVSTPIPQNNLSRSPNNSLHSNYHKSYIVNPIVTQVSAEINFSSSHPTMSTSVLNTFPNSSSNTHMKINERMEEQYMARYKSMNLSDLHVELKSLKESKRVLQKLLKDFEHEFERREGRKLELSDRLPMHLEYNRYKTLKTRLSCLERLLESQSTGV